LGDVPSEKLGGASWSVFKSNKAHVTKSVGQTGQCEFSRRHVCEAGLTHGWRKNQERCECWDARGPSWLQRDRFDSTGLSSPSNILRSLKLEIPQGARQREIPYEVHHRYSLSEGLDNSPLTRPYSTYPPASVIRFRSAEC
jgi:hypothetical protein